MQVKSGVLGLPSYTQFQIRNHFLAVHPVVARAVVPIITQFSNLLTVTISFDPSTVTVFYSKNIRNGFRYVHIG